MQQLLAAFQLHLKDGTVHRHGPRRNPCPGSDKPPLDSSQAAQAPTCQSSTTSSSYQSLNSSQLSAINASQSAANHPAPDFQHPAHAHIIKRIPKAARPACCKHLSELVRKVTQDPSHVPAWSALFGFGQHILGQPPRGGKRHNLTSTIKKRTTEPAQPAVEEDEAGPKYKKKSASEVMAAAVSAKIEDGNIRAALRILCSDDKPADMSQATLTKLEAKHPAAPLDRSSAPDPNQFQALQVTEEDVMRAIRSFPAGSSAGPDGVRPQHILDMVSCREGGQELAITAFVNMLLDGKCPPNVIPILFGGNLIALEKKSGGIRPIAVGYIWRRLAAKCANAYAISRLTSFFSPRQLGVGVPGGCEAAVHATRRFVQSMPEGYAVAKLDFTNAFNCLHRDAMLQSVIDQIPEIYKFCHLSYSKPSILKFGKFTVLSQVGPQQGDPLGALLYCLPTHKILTNLQSELVAGYMDDLTLGAPEDTLASDIDHIRREGEAIGLQLNTAKCELINATRTHQSSNFQDFIHLTPEEADLLGAPISVGSALDNGLSSRCDELTLAIGKLKFLTAHDALILLRMSFSAPKILHTLRCSPCAGHPSLARFDDILRHGLNTIINIDLSDDQWIQASLPVKDAGLGVRRVSSLAPSAFLASAASTHALQDLLLSGCQRILGDSSLDIIMSMWTSGNAQPCPQGPAAHKQQNWDRPSITADMTHLLNSQTDNLNRARLLATRAPHSGDWLMALPLSTCGLRLDNEAIRVAVGLRLGLPICESHKCPCGAMVDSKGIHSLSCKLGSGKALRHNQINDIIWRALTRAGVPSTKEPNGLCFTDERRPDGMTLIPWSGGRSVTWDVTVVNPLADSYLSTSSQRTGGVAELAATRKETKYADLMQRYSFIPIAVETIGTLNVSALNFISDLGRRISAISGDPRETCFLLQQISVVVQRFNSIIFHDGFPIGPDDES